jgi:hypothetical protein
VQKYVSTNLQPKRILLSKQRPNARAFINSDFTALATLAFIVGERKKAGPGNM